MLKAKIFLIKHLLSMSKGFLDHNLFHDPNVTTIHRDYPDNREKDVRISILWPALVVETSSERPHEEQNYEVDIWMIKKSPFWSDFG